MVTKRFVYEPPVALDLSEMGVSGQHRRLPPRPEGTHRQEFGIQLCQVGSAPTLCSAGSHVVPA